MIPMILEKSGEECKLGSQKLSGRSEPGKSHFRIRNLDSPKGIRESTNSTRKVPNGVFLGLPDMPSGMFLHAIVPCDPLTGTVSQPAWVHGVPRVGRGTPWYPACTPTYPDIPQSSLIYRLMA